MNRRYYFAELHGGFVVVWVMEMHEKNLLSIFGEKSTTSCKLKLELVKLRSTRPVYFLMEQFQLNSCKEEFGL